MTVEDLLTTLSDCTFSTVKIGHSIGVYIKISGVSVAMIPEKLLNLEVVEWRVHYAEDSKSDRNYIFIETF